MGGLNEEMAVEMFEQMVDSGMLQGEDLASLKGQLAQSMGMPVEEVLRRKDELKREMPPEGQKLLDLIDRLFGEGSMVTASSAAAADVAKPAEDSMDDRGFKVTVKKNTVPLDAFDETAPNAPGVSVQIKVMSAGKEDLHA